MWHFVSLPKKTTTIDTLEKHRNDLICNLNIPNQNRQTMGLFLGHDATQIQLSYKKSLNVQNDVIIWFPLLMYVSTDVYNKEMIGYVHVRAYSGSVCGKHLIICNV